MMEPSDEALVLACKRGDAKAWETLVERYQRLIYTIPRRAGLDESLASDVFQRVFGKLLEKLHEIEQPERIQAWLVTTARRETWAIIRRYKNSVVLDEEQSDEARHDLSDDGPLPDEVLIELEEQHTIRTTLLLLDPRCRTLLTLLFYQDPPPSYLEIAEQLGTSEGSIGPTRARCLQKLQKELERNGF
jgi:RNA polymerase sigma factor (sigma-70 family)